MKLKLLINVQKPTWINMLNKGIRLDYCFPVELSVEIKEEKGNLITKYSVKLFIVVLLNEKRVFSLATENSHQITIYVSLFYAPTRSLMQHIETFTSKIVVNDLFLCQN